MRENDAKSAGCQTLVDVLELRAERDAEKTAYRFLSSSGDVENSLTNAELRRRTASMASLIADIASPGDRVVILLPPGLEYIVTLYACIYAGVIAVPAYPPNPRRPDGRVAGIVSDCSARVAIVTSALHHRLAPLLASSPSLHLVNWVDVETLSADASRALVRPATRDGLAFLQYTSGSTGDPRGVMLPHAAVMHNLDMISRALDHQEGDEGLFWLPPYHDMGLVGAILQPLYANGPVNLMSPSSFAQRPVSWLQAMSTFRATTTGGPNFAYDLCVDRISEEEKSSLDLSRWRVAINGAEPVRAETIERFAAAFKSAGFDSRAFLPCYGLAETTLLATGRSAAKGPTVLSVDSALLEARVIAPAATARADRLVTAGPAAEEITIRIVDQSTGAPMSENEIGEIWISGDSVASGYWGREEETALAFNCTLPDSDLHFLRTGDLGAMHDGELVVTGRLKDLVIIGGRNFYPQDIERAAESAHPHIRAGASAAFSTGTSGRERLVVVAEVIRQHRQDDTGAVIKTIRQAIANSLGIVVDDVALIKHGTLPKTSSGKLQRRFTRSHYERSELALVSPATVPPPVVPQGSLAFILQWLADEFQVPEGVATADTSLRDNGLDSLAATRLVVALESHLGKRVDASLLWRSATIGEFATALDGVHGERMTGVTEHTGPAASFAPFHEWPEYRTLRHRLADAEGDQLCNPYFAVHEATSGASAIIGGRTVINFSSYNYLGLSGHAEVIDAAYQAMQLYGTSVSASRIASGERPVHGELERGLAAFLGAEDSLVFVGGHATNVSVISHLFGPGDLVVCDELMHNSAVQGAAFSGARWVTFKHNDPESCASILTELRQRHRRALVVIEGVYSADGDVPDLRRFVEVKEKHGAMLLVDEAHSLGVLGTTGRGIVESSGMDASSVDILMGTLSKALASCGGYIAGSSALIEYLKYTAPGFVYSVGISPPNAAAALAALRILEREPKRVHDLRANAALFSAQACEAGLNIGHSEGTGVIPVVVGDSRRAVRMAQALLERGINVTPMISPSVANDQARLRFFISSEHTADQLRLAVLHTAAAMLADAQHRVPLALSR